MVMAGSVSSDYLPSRGSSAVDGLSKIQQCQSVESLSEWRGSDQVENGTPSTSPLYWDSDDDDDAGPKPSDLFVTFTWKIENFSQISKRELRSNPFEIGGYKWYVLVYPQGCDVSNHLSLFLCVANHDKLLPGWSHYAQFTIAVLNKDPKKNKYSDTLHRFWKKEHDWGWKKFMELTKVTDGFVDDDNSLSIKAQVQVIRERAHRPFRCLDCQYRRELIRVYMSNVEQTCRRFVEERWRKINNLLDDKMKLSSFHAFWLAIDQTTRRYMSRDKTEVILKVVVKHFFVEKEVQSTFVMDSLYTGLKALENQRKVKKMRVHLLEKDESPAPIIFIENDMFVLADDLFLLLERAALEFHKFDSLSPSKVEKGLPSRTKDGCSGDEYLRDERRLTELGRRTLEIFVLAHIFSRIEIAYQEAVALKRQEELIREEEAAEQAENERKERRAKKKQAKQRRNNRKGKDRGNDEKSIGMLSEKSQPLKSSDEQVNEKLDSRGGISDASDLGEDDASEALQPDIIIEDRTVEQTGDVEKRSSSNMDDSSSTCSTDSVPSVVVNGPYKGNSWIGNKNNRNSSNRGKNQRKKDKQTSFLFDADLVLCDTSKDTGEPEGKLKSQIQAVEQKFTEKEEVVGTIAPSSSSSFASPSGEPEQSKDRHTTITAKEQVSSASCTTNHTKKSDHLSSSKSTMRSFSISKSEAPQRASTQSTATKGTSSSMSRPSSAPLIPVQKPSAPLVSPPWTVSSASSLGAQNFEPQSYRNAIMGIKTAVGSTTVRLTSQASSSSSTQSTSFSSSSSAAAAASAHDGISFGSFPKLHTWTGGQTYHRHLNDNCESAVPQGMIPDEFPHLDIINDLLDEDRMVGNYYHHDKYLPYTFPPDLDPLVVGACGFELPECYYDEISQMVYNSTYFPPSVHDLPLTDYPVVYGNGMDASFLQNQWGIDGTEVSMMNFGSGMDVNGYHPYQLPEYSYNMMYQPANRLKF